MGREKARSCLELSVCKIVSLKEWPANVPGRGNNKCKILKEGIYNWPKPLFSKEKKNI